MKANQQHILPPTANIPKEWIVKEDGFNFKVKMPSVSRCAGVDDYLVNIEKFTREVTCPCRGFTRWGQCRHVNGLIWITSKPRKKKGMKTGVTDTSMEAIYSFSPEELAAREKMVYDSLMKRPMSIREIAEDNETHEKNITGRLMGLRNKGMVECAGDKYDNVTNKRVKIWSVV